MIYVRLVSDLYEIVCEATGNIGNIDKISPNASIIDFSTNTVTVGESVTVTVSQSDDLSGIDIKNCKYVFTMQNTEIGTEDISKYIGTFKKEIDDTLTLNCPKAGTYYLHVLSVDLAGNKKETISSIGVKATYTYTIISDGILQKTNYFYCGQTVGVPGGIKQNTAFENHVVITLWNALNTYSAATWNVPVMGENATVVYDMETIGGNTEVRTTYLFGAAIQPNANSVSTGPYTSFYGSQTIIGGNNNTNRQTYQVSLTGIKDSLHVGFFLNTANTSLQRRKKLLCLYIKSSFLI